MSNIIGVTQNKSSSVSHSGYNRSVKFREVPYGLGHLFSNMVDRVMMPHLSSTEYKVMRYILTSSLGWNNKEGCILNTREMTEGTNPFMPTRVSNGTGVSYNSTVKALKRLCDIGLIVTKVSGYARFVWLNFAFQPHRYLNDNWPNDTVGRADYWNTKLSEHGFVHLPSHSMVEALYAMTQVRVKEMVNIMLRKSKKAQERAAMIEQSDNDDLFGTTVTEAPKEELTLEQVAAGSRRKTKRTVNAYVPTLEEVQERYKHVSKQKAKAKADKVVTVDTVPKLEEQWNKGITELYDVNYGKVSWGPKQRGMVKTFKDKMTLTPDERVEFFYYIAKNWTTITATHYSWVKDFARTTPDLSLLVARPSGFLEAFNNRAELDMATRMTRKAKSTGKVAGKAAPVHVKSYDRYTEMLRNPADVNMNSPEYMSLPVKQKMNILKAVRNMNSETGFTNSNLVGEYND